MNSPSNTMLEVGLSTPELENGLITRNWKRNSIPANAMLTGSDIASAIDVLPLIMTQALRNEMNPPLISIPERIRARLHVINALVITMEYTIPPNRVMIVEWMLMM